MKRPPPQPTELETQVEKRKRELISEIVEHKKNSSRYGAAEAIDRIKGHLLELSHIVKLVDRWSTITPEAKSRLTDWIAR